MAGPPYPGRCGCGAVRFVVTERPVSVGSCHCTRCQRRTGTAASANARLASRESLHIDEGEEPVGDYQPESRSHQRAWSSSRSEG